MLQFLLLPQLCVLKKLQLCSWPMDFTNGQIDARDKEIKRQTLLELMDYINSTKGDRRAAH